MFLIGLATTRQPTWSSDPPRGYSIPLIDLADSDRTAKSSSTARRGSTSAIRRRYCWKTSGRSLRSTPRGTVAVAIVMKRSEDGGLTWSDRLPVPPSWATSQETPTIHRVVDAAGRKRLIVWSGLYPARLAVSEDDGRHWSELQPAGPWGGIVVMSSVVPLSTAGHYLALFHDDGRFFHARGRRGPFTLYQCDSRDGGLNWSLPQAILSREDVHLCEPGAIRSPDGRQLAVVAA